jgi:hypothetical protein
LLESNTEQLTVRRGATARGHYGHFRAELAKNLPSGAFDDLAGHLKNGHYRAELAKGLPAGEFDALAGHFKKKCVPSPFGEKIDAPEATPQRELLRQKMAQKRAASTITCIVGEESKTASGKRTKKENERTNQKAPTAPPQKERPALRQLNASAAPQPPEDSTERELLRQQSANK